MLTSIHIQGFKNFKDTKIESLRKVNLILGGQNVGKTSLLEAVWLRTCRQNDGSKTSALFRPSEGKDDSRYWKYIGEDWDVILNGISMDSKEYHDWIDHSDYIASPFIMSTALPNQSAICKLLDNVIISKNKKKLIQMLKKIEPRLDDINSIAPDDECRVYIELNDFNKAIPLPQFGHGFNRLFCIYCGLLQTNAYIALIDEIENGVYYEALPTVFQGIRDLSINQDIQSFITTHSWECLRAACEVFSDKPELFQVIRLERDGDNTKAVCIEGERMLRMMERDMEVR